ADCGCSVECLVEVNFLQDRRRLPRVYRVEPDASETVGLKFDIDLDQVPTLLMSLLESSQKVLDVMGHLVGHDVRLSGIPGRSETLLEVPKEVEVHVDVLVSGAIVGSVLSECTPAARFGTSVKDDHVGGAIGD